MVLNKVAPPKYKKAAVETLHGGFLIVHEIRRGSFEIKAFRQKKKDCYSIKIAVLFWWRRGELNPCPKTL